jgi:manganese-dependent inorganic pyrophosphatase
MPTAIPIRFRIEPVGSCSTLVAERAIDLGQPFPPPIAGLLLCGILSDTLIFKSPTVTARDHSAASWLALNAKLAPAGANEAMIDAAISELGQQLLAAGAGLGSRPVDEIINNDVKFYEINGAKVGIAQVEVTNLTELASRLPELREGLGQLAETHNLKLAVLMITDVVLGNSRLVTVGQPRIITALPYPRLNDDTLDAPGIMSRKKQLLPTVLAVLSQSV